MKSSHFKQGSIFSRDKDTASTVSDFKFFSIKYEILDRFNFNFCTFTYNCAHSTQRKLHLQYVRTLYIVQGTQVMVNALLCSSSEYNDDQRGCMSVMMPAANLLKTDPSFCSLSNDPDGPFKGTVAHSFPICLLILRPIRTGRQSFIFFRFGWPL
jgi:hypothetical protein